VPSSHQSDIVKTQLLNPTRRQLLAIAPASTTSSCTVPGCPIPSCRLRSHQQYAGITHLQYRKTRQRRPQTKQPGGESLNASDAWPHLLPPTPTIERDGVDGFPFMPIPNQLDPELRELFNHFFANVFDRLVLIFRAPPIAKDFKPRMLQVALTTPAYCMALIAQSRTDADISRDQFSEDRKSLALYGKVLEVYRHHLTVMQPAHVDILLLVIVILLTYDMIHGRLQSAAVHWNGMQQLVSFRGGIHNIGVSLAYVVHADRVIATFNNKEPAYPSPADRSIQLLRRPKFLYGYAFASSGSFIESGILTQRSLDYCRDTVQLVELFESTQMCFDPKKSGNSRIRDVEYFYYSRDRLDGQFPILNAKLYKHRTQEYCIVLAARLAEYPITWANYVPTLTMLLANQLQGILKQDDMLLVWHKSLDILSWILFVAAIAPVQREIHAWMIDALGRTIVTKHGLAGRAEDVQPEVWRKVEWDNVRMFIWSDTHMRDKFDKVCDELESTWSIPSIVKNEENAQACLTCGDVWSSRGPSQL